MTSTPDLFLDPKVEYLLKARREAVRIALNDPENKVSADMVNKTVPRPDDVKASVSGSMFKVKDMFKWVGTKKSESDKRNSGSIAVWQLVSIEKAMKYLGI